MSTPPKLASLLDHWIKPIGKAMTAHEKLDVLDRAVEWMRLELRHGRNQLDMVVFLRSHLAVRYGVRAGRYGVSAQLFENSLNRIDHGPSSCTEGTKKHRQKCLCHLRAFLA